MRVAKVITLTDEERTTLTKWSRGRSTAERLVMRAKIVLAAAGGRRNDEIAAELKYSAYRRHLAEPLCRAASGRDSTRRAAWRPHADATGGV